MIMLLKYVPNLSPLRSICSGGFYYWSYSPRGVALGLVIGRNLRLEEVVVQIRIPWCKFPEHRLRHITRFEINYQLKSRPWWTLFNILHDMTNCTSSAVVAYYQGRWCHEDDSLLGGEFCVLDLCGSTSQTWLWYFCSFQQAQVQIQQQSQEIQQLREQLVAAQS